MVGGNVYKGDNREEGISAVQSQTFTEVRGEYEGHSRVRTQRYHVMNSNV